MKELIKSYKNLIGILVLALIVVVACSKDNYTLTTTDDVNITGYLEKYPDQFSLLSKIIAKSGNEGYLGAYGTYTLFAPNNTGIDAWLKTNAKTIESLTVDEAKDFVKYHLIPDTVSTQRFTDGKIATKTLFGEFLYTDVLAGSGYRVNKSANIVKTNIRCGNGMIHAIDKVLTPPVKSLAQTIEADTRYSIFAQALKETGFYDSLSYKRGDAINPNRRFQTVIVESNDALKSIGVNSYSDLKALLSKGNPMLHSDSLWLYVAYHISTQPNYLSDIAQASSIYTLAPSEIITTKLSGTKVLLNEDTYNGKIEPGVELDRAHSDVTASNGVLHEVKSSFRIKVRKQIPVYWEITDQPELRAAIGAAYQKPVSTTTKSEIIVNGASITSAMTFSRLTGVQSVNYNNNPSGYANRQCSHNDQLVVSGSPSSTARQQWFTVKTPLLVKGKYKVWVCYTSLNSSSDLWQVTYNPGMATEQVLPNLVDLRIGLTASGLSSADLGLPNADNLLLAQGYKRYMPTSAETNKDGIIGSRPVSGTYSDVQAGRLVGTINVESTDRQILKFTVLGGGTASEYNLFDMVHFIPADDTEQNYPRFHPDGYVFYRKP